MYGAASKLFGIERETAVLGVKLDRLETSHGELKAGLSKVEGYLSKVEAGLSKIEGDLRYYFFASVILSALILLKR